MRDTNKENSYIKKNINTLNHNYDLKLLFFLIIPIILIFLFIKLNSVRGYYYLGSNSDPEYAYLLNSLKISELKEPSHIDHPGTTLQLLGGFIIRALNINKSTNNIQIDVLINSENYLSYINIFLLFLVILAVLLLGAYIYKITGNIWFGIILQLSVLYSSNTYVELSRVRPEYLLILASLALTLTIISLLKNNLSSKINRYIIAFSLISGFGMATKIIFFPILLFPLIILPSIKNKAYYTIGTMMSFVMFTFPIIKQYGKIFDWIKALFFHSGAYGSGPVTIIDPSLYLNNIKLALSDNVIFSIILFISVIFIITNITISRYRDHAKQGLEFKILISLTVTQIIQILLVSKQYSSHYLIPSLMLTGVIIVFLIINVKKIFNFRPSRKYYFGVIVTIFAFSYYSVNTFSSVASLIEKIKNDQMSVVNTANDAYKNYAKIYYYRSSAHGYALKFGNDFSGNEYSHSLNQQYPNSYFYNIWDKKYYNFSSEPIDLKTIISTNNNVLYEGTSFEKHYQYIPCKPENVSLDDIYNGNEETIYILKK